MYNMESVKCGDILWACAYQLADDNKTMLYHEKPIEGMVMPCKTKRQYLAHTWTRNDIAYFIPFKITSNGRNIDDLAWSKAIPTYKRRFAYTKDECVMLYNSLIQNYVQHYQEQIAIVLADMI